MYKKTPTNQEQKDNPIKKWENDLIDITPEKVYK